MSAGLNRKVSKGDVWMGVLALAAVLVFLLGKIFDWWGLFEGGSKPSSEAVDTTAEDVRVGVRVWCARNLNDPDYEVAEWGVYAPDGEGGYVAQAKIRARNAFNAPLVKWMVFRLDGDFQVTEATEK